MTQAGQLPPTDNAALRKRSENDGGELAFSDTLFDRPLGDKPLRRRQMGKLLKKSRAVPEYGRNSPRR